MSSLPIVMKPLTVSFVHHLRSEALALAEELLTARQRIQELEISLAVSQTE
jgi:hypothetical protein